MNWEAIGAIAEALGAIAVIATLAYLAVQLKQNTASVRVATASAQSDAWRSGNMAVVQDPELVRLYWSGLADRAALSDDDQRRFDFLIGATTQALEQMWKFQQVGVIDAATWAGQEVAVSWLVHQPGFADFWRIWGPTHNVEFGKFVAQTMADDLRSEAANADDRTPSAGP